MGNFFSLGKSSNDTQENPKDAQGREEALKKVQEVQEENTKLNRERTDLITEKDNLTNQLNASQKQVKELEQSQQVLKNEKAKLLKEKDNLNTDLSNAKSQAEQTSQKLKELERRHAPYEKLEKLYEVFLEVKDRLNFNFVATTHSAMDLIASVLSDSKYYLENLYNKASQELSDKRSDKGEKLAELFDLLFEYIKDSKFERLKEPSTYDHSCKTLYPEQNSSQKIQRVVLRGYTYDKKIACYTIVDMGS
ncbi:M protein [Helicobacter pylori]|uniref:M protein n=1 Tax=Helicobacter pylori TaxID=210 RepID=UPI00165C4AC9